jgi:uncharacterized protein (DUF885 family)
VHDRLATLAQTYWYRLMAANPTWATLLGDHRWDDQMEDPSRQAEDALHRDLLAIIAEVEALDPATLGSEDRITRGALLMEAAGQAEALETRAAEYLVDPMIGPHMSIVSYIPQMTPTTAEQAAALVDKAAKVGVVFDHAGERLLEGIAKGRTPVAVLVEKSLDQMAAFLASPIDTDPFLRIGPPDDMTGDDVARWRDRMKAAVEASVRPGIQRYHDLIRDKVLPAARPSDKAGVCWLPDGEEIYARAVSRYTTLDHDAPSIHQIGLDDIAALEEEYRAMGSTVLGTADLAEIYQRLRDDPELRFSTSEEVMAQAERAMARANEATPGWFGRLPETPCIVQAIPEVGADEAPLAYYLPPATDGARPGIFFINITEPKTRAVFESDALAFHEGVPGHHFQIALGQELTDLPEFRKQSLATAFVEGWGLYTERLADEMGLYSGEVERMGMLSFDSWRAGRLVVDTGMHALGWSRQQALDYLAANSPQAENNIVNEVDRYIGWPGQALAYKMGQRELFRLRAEAKATLGSRFDIKGFHDTVLGHGALPLPVLGGVVSDWVAAH